MSKVKSKIKEIGSLLEVTGISKTATSGDGTGYKVLQVLPVVQKKVGDKELIVKTAYSPRTLTVFEDGGLYDSVKGDYILGCFEEYEVENHQIDGREINKVTVAVTTEENGQLKAERLLNRELEEQNITSAQDEVERGDNPLK